MSIIEVDNLSFNIEKRNIFEKISFKIEQGKITAIMGPSGCGKTTLLKLIINQIKDYAGIIKINNKDIKLFSNDEIYSLRKNIGVLFQNSALFSDLTVYENIAFPIREHTNLSEKLIKDLVLMKLQSVGLRKVGYLMPSQLSGGMIKRAALARAISLDPGIIIYDEPFVGQDPISMSVLIKLIKLLNNLAKITTIIISHDIYETLSISDYVYIINDKRIVVEGKPWEILNSTDAFVKSFLNINLISKNGDSFLVKDYEKDLFLF